MQALRIFLTALALGVSGVAWASPSDVEADFAVKGKDYKQKVGATDEAFCGGNSLTVYLDGKAVRKMDYFMETSSQAILREYYFEGKAPVLVVESIYNLRDANGVQYKRPRPATKKTVTLTAGRDTALHKELRKQGRFLLKYFRQHEADFE